MPPSKLFQFLDGTNNQTDSDKKREGRKAEGEKTTHGSMSGGAWAIDDDDLPEFYKLYCDYIRSHGPLHMTEKSTRIGALRVDLDFLYDGKLENHLHTQEQTVEFVKAYMSEVKKYIKLDDITEVVVMEKPEPTIKGSTSKSGIHLVVPDVKSNRYVEEAIRRTLQPRMGKDFFPELPVTEDWRKVYDPSPLTHTNNWTLLGSKKKDGTPYAIKYTIDYDPDTDEVSVDENVPQAITPELVKRLSVRSAPIEETPMTDEGKKLVEEMSRPDPVRVSGGTAIQPGRGRQLARGEVQSRSSSAERAVYMEPLSEAMLKYYSAHAFNLSEFRYKDYKEWIEVGQCLKNIHPDLESLWLEFSGQDSRYNPRETMNKWNSFGFRTDGPKLSIGSLRLWSRMDNPEKYIDIEKTNVARLVEESAVNGTEHDVAQVVFSLYRDEFKCARFGTNTWYRWRGHVWRETDKGVALQCLLSSSVCKEYFKKRMECLRTKEGCDPCQCTKGEKNPNCESCKWESQSKKYEGMETKLRTTRFKENVMKECRELFLDEEFAEKLDETRHLIAFNNGVFDTMGSDDRDANGNYVRPWFRDGRPDDYLSFSTNLNYDPNKLYYTFDCWPEIDKFIKSILPNPKVREYFVRHMSTCLSGGNDAQKFHILTGAGSNGKSMVTNLMSTTMGDYACKVPISLLTQKRNKSAAAAPEMVRLKGRRWATMQEPDEQVPLNTGLMKELASCEKISVRDLYQGSKQMVDFEVQASLHLSCNEKPEIKTTDGGTWRRLVVISFPMKFVAEPKGKNELPMDDRIVQKVVSVDWATCFLAYLVHVFKEGKGWRKLTPPEEVMEYTNEYKEESDVIARFLREKIQPTDDAPVDAPADPVTKTSLNATFQDWKRSNEIIGRASTAELDKRMEVLYGKYPKNGWTSFRFAPS